MAEEKNILIVEDDPDISMIEEVYLQSAGFGTKILSDGNGIRALLEQEKYDLILLDLMLPGKSGYEICREIRDQVDIPILMVTARTETVDKLKGFGVGADDYIAKPFDPAELVARVRANLRQSERGRTAQPAPSQEEEIRIGDLRILVNNWKVYKGDRELKLPNREFELLKFLRRIPILCSPRSSCLKKYGDMIMWETVQR